jgi:pimeloyl-ACP methyl ester carboxylesterase
VDTNDRPVQSNHSRCRFLGTAGAAALAVGATQLGMAGGAMAQANAAVRPAGAKTLGKRADGTAIWPFPVPVTPEAELQALRARINATRWPDRELVADHSQGFQLEVAEELARYWAQDYDWRRFEARFSALLTNPTAHGASAADAFDLVIPSIPGYGYSGKPRETGWGPVRIARAWAELMKRLGYTHYVAQGGDWGAIITDLMSAQAPPALLGMHSNMPGTVPADIATALAQNVLGAGGPPPSGLSADENRAYQELNFFYTHGLGYGIEMATQPQTIYGVADSPVGLASWMFNHDAASYQDVADVFAGHPVGNLTRDQVLDDVTFHWLTNTAISSARLYWENTVGFFNVKNVSIPAAVTVFPHEIYQAPRSWAEKAYPKLMYFHEVDRGCHFAAWQEPALLSAEVRAAFRSLR